MNIHWDAEGYTRNFSFVHEYGSGLLDLLDPKEGAVLDLGCGNGALTFRLSQAGYTAHGLDASPELLAVARTSYPQLTFYQGDATDFQATTLYDAVFSNAVFHWIEDGKQDDMLRCVNRALKPGGQFVFEFGGQGNNALIHAALEEAFRARGLVYRMPFYFPSIGQYAPRLERAGFRVVYAALFDRPTPLQGEEGLYDWLRMFIKAPFAGLGETDREEILRDAVARLRERLYRDGTWYSDYVRIRCKAVKTEQPAP